MTATLDSRDSEAAAPPAPQPGGFAYSPAADSCPRTLQDALEADALRRARAGDEQAFGVLAERYQERAYRVALGILRDEEEARDVVQDALLRAFASMDRFEGRSRFYTWLYRLVVNRCLDVIRARRPAPVLAGDGEEFDAIEAASAALPPPEVAGIRFAPAVALRRKEIREQIANALVTLSDDAAQAFLLRDVEGLAYAEIAEIQDVPVGTVTSRIHTARSRMAHSLRREAVPEGASEPGAGRVPDATNTSTPREVRSTLPTRALNVAPTRSMKILCIEDDRSTQALIEQGLRRYDVSTDLAPTLAQGLELARCGGYDALVIDVMLPDGEGLELLRELRTTGDDTPALILSARGEVGDRIRGLEIGADDYLAKPFALAELRARLQAIARRRLGEPADGQLQLADLAMDVPGHSVSRNGQRIELTPKQFSLLRVLLQSSGRVLSRDVLGERVWGPDADHRSNAIDVQINYLRKKIDHGFEPKLIHTVPGVGYVLEDRSGA